MKSTTKVLLIGLAFAASIVAAGSWRAERLADRLSALVEECSANPEPWEHVKNIPAPPAGYVLDPLVCDPDELTRLGVREGLQGQIVDAHFAALAADEAPWFWAGIVTVLCAIPWSWYFLLRRLGEIRSALAGNPPSR